MKITLTKSEFINRFLAVRAENFSRSALGALFDWYEELHEGSGTEMEFDPIAICCDWTEYATALEAAEAYGFLAPKEIDDERADRSEQQALEWLCDETTAIETESGVVVMNY